MRATRILCFLICVAVLAQATLAACDGWTPIGTCPENNYPLRNAKTYTNTIRACGTDLCTDYNSTSLNRTFKYINQSFSLNGTPFVFGGNKVQAEVHVGGSKHTINDLLSVYPNKYYFNNVAFTTWTSPQTTRQMLYYYPATDSIKAAINISNNTNDAWCVINISIQPSGMTDIISLEVWNGSRNTDCLYEFKLDDTTLNNNSFSVYDFDAWGQTANHMIDFGVVYNSFFLGLYPNIYSSSSSVISNGAPTKSGNNVEWETSIYYEELTSGVTPNRQRFHEVINLIVSDDPIDLFPFNQDRVSPNQELYEDKALVLLESYPAGTSNASANYTEYITKLYNYELDNLLVIQKNMFDDLYNISNAKISAHGYSSVRDMKASYADMRALGYNPTLPIRLSAADYGDFHNITNLTNTDDCVMKYTNGSNMTSGGRYWKVKMECRNQAITMITNIMLDFGLDWVFLDGDNRGGSWYWDHTDHDSNSSVNGSYIKADAISEEINDNIRASFATQGIIGENFKLGFGSGDQLDAGLYNFNSAVLQAKNIEYNPMYHYSQEYDKITNYMGYWGYYFYSDGSTTTDLNLDFGNISQLISMQALYSLKPNLDNPTSWGHNVDDNLSILYYYSLMELTNITEHGFVTSFGIVNQADGSHYTLREAVLADYDFSNGVYYTTWSNGLISLVNLNKTGWWYATLNGKALSMPPHSFYAYMTNGTFETFFNDNNNSAWVITDDYIYVYPKAEVGYSFSIPTNSYDLYNYADRKVYSTSTPSTSNLVLLQPTYITKSTSVNSTRIYAWDTGEMCKNFTNGQSATITLPIIGAEFTSAQLAINGNFTSGMPIVIEDGINVTTYSGLFVHNGSGSLTNPENADDGDYDTYAHIGNTGYNYNYYLNFTVLNYTRVNAATMYVRSIQGSPSTTYYCQNMSSNAWVNLGIKNAENMTIIINQDCLGANTINTRTNLVAGTAYVDLYEYRLNINYTTFSINEVNSTQTDIDGLLDVTSFMNTLAQTTNTFDFVFYPANWVEVCLHDFYYLPTYYNSLAWSGNVTGGGNNWARNLTYTANVTCIIGTNVNVSLYVNNTLNQTNQITCYNASHLYTYWFMADDQKDYDLSVYVNEFLGNTTFTFDLYDPVTTINFTYNEGFGGDSADTNVTILCEDNKTTTLLYNNTFNNVTLNLINTTNGTTFTNYTSLTIGANTLIGECSDYLSSTREVLTHNVWAKQLCLVDERTGGAFDVSNLTNVRIFIDDNNVSYDLKSAGVNCINFTGSNNVKTRTELEYLSGDIITRYVDVSLLDDPVLRICANLEGVSHYEQLIISATQRPVVMRSVFANCTVATDYTRFAYQDSYSLKAYTIDTQYYLWVWDEGNRIYLAGVDGSIATYINLDVIEFSRAEYDIGLGGETFYISRGTGQQMNIYYYNHDDDLDQIRLTITRTDTGAQVMNVLDGTTPNNFSAIYSYATEINISNTTVFKAVLNKYKDGVLVDTLEQYFNVAGITGGIPSQLAAIIAAVLLVFGFTWTISRITFSYLGVFVCLSAIVILAFAIPVWYISLMLGVSVVILIFTFIVMIQQNNPTIS